MQKTVFVVDDIIPNLDDASNALEAEFSLYTMGSVEKMFHLLENMTPDLILMDVEIPGEYNLNATVKLKKNPLWKNIPIVYYTGVDKECLWPRAMILGVHDVLKKPCPPERLRRYVKGYIMACERLSS